MMTARFLPRSVAPLLIGFASVYVAGCSTLQKEEPANTIAQWNQGDEQPAAEKQPTGPTYTVEIRRPGYTTQFARIAHAGETHLQDALAKAGAVGKLKRMELYVMRSSPQGGPRQRLAAEYDSAEKRVKWESDYAVYPGDHIVAIEDTSSEFDDMISRFMGPFGTK